MALGKSDSLLHRRNKGDQRHSPNEGDDDILDSILTSTSQKPNWSVLIVVLVLVNVILGYVHVQRRARNKGTNVVNILTDASFSSHIASHPNGTLVNFFSPSCKHCEKVAPEFEEAAKQLLSTNEISLVSVDGSKASLTLRQYNVTRFPTLLWFRRGRLVREAPPAVRITTKILEFVEESLQPAVIDFTSHTHFDEAVPQLRSVLSNGKALPVVVGFAREPAVYDVLEEVGEKFRGSTAFLFVKEAQENDPRIRVYFGDSEADKEYNGSLNVDDLQSWLQPLMDRKPQPQTSKAFA